MGRKDRESISRDEGREWFIDDAGKDDKRRAQDRSANGGDIGKSMSSHTDDSSHAHESEGGSENSRYTTDEDSASGGSSYETESYLSSILEEIDLAADTEELLENEQIMLYESKPGLVGGWLDFACGWMDRPNMCAGHELDIGSRTSLLRRSKAANAIHRVKLNETFKRAADNASASNEKKSKSAMEKIQRDVAKAAAAAAESVRKQEVQPSEVTVMQEERDEEEQRRRRKNKRKASKPKDDNYNEDIEAKMKQVSARAAEILKNTIEARSKTLKEREESPPKHVMHAEIRKKVFDQLERDRTSSSTEEEIIPEAQAARNSGDAGQVSHDARGQPTRSTWSTNSVEASETMDHTLISTENHSVVESLHDAYRKEEPEDDDIESVNCMKRSSSASPSPHEQDSSDYRLPDTSANLSITDLTHIVDSNQDDDDQEIGNSGEHVERRDDSKPPKLRGKAPSKRSTKLASLHKNDLGKGDIEFIDVLELDDEDSWTPGEILETVPSRSRYDSNKAYGNRGPTETDRASLFGANIPVALSHQEQRQTQKKTRDAAFNDPRAREAFAGLRRGHLETNDRAYDRTFHALRSQTSPVIEAEMALRKSNSREPHHFSEKPVQPRRRVAEMTNTSSGDARWNTDTVSRRSTHLVAVRSIDEAQRLRNERSRDQQDSSIPAPRSRDIPRQSVTSGYRTANIPESSLDVHPYLMSRATDHDQAAARSGRTYQHQYDSPRLDRHPSIARQPISRDQELYSSLVINLSKSRDGTSSEYVEERVADRGYVTETNSRHGMPRGRDTRDDSDTPNNPGRSDPTGYIPHRQYRDTMASRRGEGMNVHVENEHLRGLKRLEKKINQQLNAQEISGWDEQTAISVKQLRQLESKLVQTLKEENEKRTDKLQRIRSRKQSRHRTDGEGSIVPESMMPPVRNVSPEKGLDLQDGRLKYSHLKVLRQARQMHKYMHQRTGPGMGSHGAAPQSEAY